MWLAVNVGNTNVKMGVVRDGDLQSSRRAATRSDSTADDVEALIAALLQLDGHRLSETAGIVLATVVPAYGEAVTAVGERRGLPVIEATADTIPIQIRYDHPTEVGADRLVNAFAAGRLYGSPAVVVDFGTATTLDAVAADGAYVGGAIAPGLELGLEALAARTAKLPRIDLRQPEQVIGRNTVAAMRSGAVFGYLGLTRELISRASRQLADESPGQRVWTILTGGLSTAPWWQELPGIDAVDPDLTLKGLALLHAELTADRQMSAHGQAARATARAWGRP